MVMKALIWIVTAALGTLGAVQISPADTPGHTLVIPGGVDALSHVCGFKLTAPPQTFLADYARAVARRLEQAPISEGSVMGVAVREHFSRVRELTAYGEQRDGQVTVTIHFQDTNNIERTRQILRLLGWRIQNSPKGAGLQPIEQGALSRGLETAAASVIDESGLQESFKARKPFSFHISSDRVGVTPAEESWQALYANEHYAGGLPEAIVANRGIAQVYAALGHMDPKTAEILVAGVGLKSLVEEYAIVLWRYSSVLGLVDGHVMVPGGQAAEAIWSSLTGASPRQPGLFFRALLNKDQGKLLAYFAGLSASDAARQRFFTQSLEYTSRFYERFKQ